MAEAHKAPNRERCHNKKRARGTGNNLCAPPYRAPTRARVGLVIKHTN